MAAELRWILLGLSVLLLVGIWWWGARRSRQAPGNAELRESTAGGSTLPSMPAHTLGSSDSHSVSQPQPRESEPTLYRAIDSEPRDWGVPPFEPLSIRTADFEHVPIIDMPMMADAAPTAAESSRVDVMDVEEAEAAIDPADEPFDESVGEPAAEAIGEPAINAPPADRSTTGAHEVPNVSETQRIVSLRVCADGDARWSGAELMAALEAHGLGFGRYKVFHRKHTDGRTLFCAASLVEPGTFDIAQMPHQDFRGLALFAVLPGPGEPVQTVDALIATATALAESLHGGVQDAKGVPLSLALAEALREDVARFQALLTMT